MKLEVGILSHLQTYAAFSHASVFIRARLTPVVMVTDMCSVA